MFLPSPLYLPAVKDIGDSGDSSRALLAVLICAIGVMLFVEMPLVAMFIRPGGVGDRRAQLNELASIATAGRGSPLGRHAAAVPACFGLAGAPTSGAALGGLSAP